MSIDSSVSFGVYNTPPSVSDTASLDPRDRSLNEGILVTENYLILDLLGSGGFASVHKAESKQDQDVYAMKVISRYHQKYGPQDEMIMNEIDLLKDLQHPSIIRYYEHYRTDSHYHLILELAAGGDLRKKLPYTVDGLNDQIRNAEVEFSSSASPQFCSLVSLLLKKDPRERLDCIEKVLEQEFFSDMVFSHRMGFD
ncbi:uncharacterized protein MELLADRAFT_111767 [Melampsora larici-populina 98AG31]|uniref:Protein kinase domain-containing protein n=1 Tax=Melampsora larici-populina (strain 98AG31 / pathotype 3-4-7) TaxID=747676 RepID=F4S458_MELLP|nr:uncharacterized protein MELLADRAFT_111767 [Melampsora larici-populina 98AG31]EGG00527.1 hypothetical protein MELLADRAFT_111767 [Melampsora larici-populina 98AG31]